MILTFLYSISWFCFKIVINFITQSLLELCFFFAECSLQLNYSKEKKIFESIFRLCEQHNCFLPRGKQKKAGIVSSVCQANFQVFLGSFSELVVNHRTEVF
jgi:hypothetical protein